MKLLGWFCHRLGRRLNHHLSCNRCQSRDCPILLNTTNLTLKLLTSLIVKNYSSSTTIDLDFIAVATTIDCSVSVHSIERATTNYAQKARFSLQ